MSGPLAILLNLGVFVGMIALCLVGWDIGGVGGVIGGALGGLWRSIASARDLNERLGNIYTGALFGMPIGLLAGGVYMVGWPLILSLYR